MTSDITGPGVPFERRLREERERLRASSSADSSAEVRVRGEGESGEGRVRAVAVTGGRIETLDIDPRVLRLEPEELAAHVGDALNFALDDVRARAGAEQADLVPDLAVLAGELQRVQNEGLRRLSVMTQGINEALAGIRDRAYVSGEAAFPGLEHLLDQAGEVARSALPGDQKERSTAEAADDDELVRVVADGAGRVEAVHLNARSLRMASHALAATIVTTANEALDSARADAAQRSKAAADPDLQERVRAVQDQSIEQLRSLMGSLTALMSSIQKR
ncbi:YbaB/EbfC family nucleoid-associated protein [Actinomadura formosensis]|uniref:YbaB/EbfC family nucleoid-associated protein n=1 Tax=Actinomadura formosensis TaxID=60706 RepID=UPI00083302F3|nr:YbaB/EbfC family nucleoid-associated protein [Actinomadura formosensis]